MRRKASEHRSILVFLLVFLFFIFASESSQATVIDAVLTTKSVRDIQEKWTELRELHVDNLYHPSKHYDIVKQIGEGSFGSVHLAKHKQIQVLFYLTGTLLLNFS